MTEPLKIHHRPSPNYNARPKGFGPDTIVLHGTAGWTDEGDLDWCCDRQAKVSYHYIIGRDGQVYMLVAESARAWHAGVSSWQGRSNVNDFSIGIAFSNRGPKPTPAEPFTEAQLHAGARLCAEIWVRRGIDLMRITDHASVSPGRKFDPWEHFDMPRFFAMVATYRFPPDPPALALPAADTIRLKAA